MLTVVPFVSRVRRRLGFEANFRHAAVERWQVEPATCTECLPALYDEEDLAKVTGAPPHTTIGYEVERLRRRVTQHPALHAFRLRDVSLVRGHVFGWTVVQPIAHKPLPSVGRGPRIEIDDGVLASTEHGNAFFGHWLVDDVPLAFQATALGEAFGHIGVDNTPSDHLRDYARLVQPPVRLLEDAHFRSLVCLEHAPENAFKAARYARVRTALASGRRARRLPGVMLLRGASGQRRLLLNEAAIADAVRRRGFAIVDPMACDVDQILDACLGARIVLGVEGSQLAHGFMAMDPSGTLFTLPPPFKFDQFWRERCDCIGARYALVVGDAADGGFTVSVPAVERMLDRIEDMAVRDSTARPTA